MLDPQVQRLKVYCEQQQVVYAEDNDRAQRLQLCRAPHHDDAASDRRPVRVSPHAGRRASGGSEGDSRRWIRPSHSRGLGNGGEGV